MIFLRNTWGALLLWVSCTSDTLSWLQLLEAPFSKASTTSLLSCTFWVVPLLSSFPGQLSSSTQGPHPHSRPDLFLAVSAFSLPLLWSRLNWISLLCFPQLSYFHYFLYFLLEHMSSSFECHLHQGRGPLPQALQVWGFCRAQILGGIHLGPRFCESELWLGQGRPGAPWVYKVSSRCTAALPSSKKKGGGALLVSLQLLGNSPSVLILPLRGTWTTQQSPADSTLLQMFLQMPKLPHL